MEPTAAGGFVGFVRTPAPSQQRLSVGSISDGFITQSVDYSKLPASASSTNTWRRGRGEASAQVIPMGPLNDDISEGSNHRRDRSSAARGTKSARSHGAVSDDDVDGDASSSDEAAFFAGAVTQRDPATQPRPQEPPPSTGKRKTQTPTISAASLLEKTRPSNTDHYASGLTPAPFDSASKRKAKKSLKGGLYEQLQRALNTNRSEVSLWNHCRAEKQNQNASPSLLLW